MLEAQHPMTDAADIEQVNRGIQAIRQFAARLYEQAGRVLVGQDNAIELLVVALLARGHVLLEGVPGTAKTLMAKTLAQLVDAEFAPAKTQAALLEAMEERQVSIEGDTQMLPDPFMVIATQNPVEMDGTYPLPEAQLDRFLFKIKVGYLPREQEVEVLRRYHNGFDAHNLAAIGLTPVVNPTQLAQIRESIQQVRVEEGILDYITAITDATRHSSDLSLGASTRAGVALLLAAKTYAALQGRDYVAPDDIKLLVPPVMRHRVYLRPEAEIEGLDTDAVFRRLLAQLEVPR